MLLTETRTARTAQLEDTASVLTFFSDCEGGDRELQSGYFPCSGATLPSWQNVSCRPAQTHTPTPSCISSAILKQGRSGGFKDGEMCPIYCLFSP